MPYVGQKPADIISTAVDTVTGKFSGEVDAASLDISGNIDVDGTTNLDVVDIDGAVDMASTLGVAGVVTANAGVVVDNITIDGTEIDLSSGDLTIDSAGQIILDYGSGAVLVKAGGTEIGKLHNSSTDFVIESITSDEDILFKGNDGGSVITALTLDMSDAGAATLNNGLTLADGNLVVASGHGIDFSANSNAGGMTSELLDSYEEGTFTPTLALSGATLASTGGTGRYTKIGRHVYVEGTVTRNTAAGGANSFVQIESLPFTSLNANSITEMGSGTIWMDEGGPGAGQGDTVGHALVASNGNVASVVRGTSSGAQTSTRYGIGSEMTNGRPLYFNFVYTTA